MIRYYIYCLQVVGKVASQTTMGFLADDHSKPKDVQEGAKIFFNDDTNINCHGDWSPKCCPLFSINNHVIDWLSQPNRGRYVEKQRTCALGKIFFVPCIDQSMSRNVTMSSFYKALL